MATHPDLFVGLGTTGMAHQLTAQPGRTPAACSSNKRGSLNKPTCFDERRNSMILNLHLFEQMIRFTSHICFQEAVHGKGCCLTPVAPSGSMICQERFSRSGVGQLDRNATIDSRKSSNANAASLPTIFLFDCFLDPQNSHL